MQRFENGQPARAPAAAAAETAFAANLPRDQEPDRAYRITNPGVIIYAGFASRGAFRLAEELGAHRFKRVLPALQNGQTWPQSPLIINWGTGYRPDWIGRVPNHWLANQYEAIELSVNKTSTLQRLRERNVRGIDFALPGRDDGSIRDWMTRDGKVIARDTVEGSNGRGARVVARGEDLGRPALVTKYFDKTHEFRIHVWEGTVIDRIQKRLMANAPTTRVQEIRSYDNGWNLTRNLDDLPPGIWTSIDTLAISAIAALQLDFGAVDILAKLQGTGPTARLIECCVCETNTAPALDHAATIDAYAAKIRATYRNLTGTDMV